MIAPRLHSILAIGSGVLLTVAVLFHTGAAYVSGFAPAFVTALRASHPASLVRLTAEETARSVARQHPERSADSLPDFVPRSLASPAEHTTSLAANEPASGLDLVELAKSAARAAPLSAEPFAALGIAASTGNDPAAADLYMAHAVRRSLRHRLGAYWMLRNSFDARNFAQTLSYADALARAGDSNIALVAPILWRVAEDTEGAPELLKILQTNPPWRQSFMQNARENISDPRTPLQVFLNLKGAGAPAAGYPELSGYIGLLLDNKLYDLAQAAWLQSLPPEQLKSAGFLYDGQFDFEPSGSPFEWRFSRDKSVAVSRAATAEASNMALSIEFLGARTNPLLASQITRLMPGDYVLRGSMRGKVMARRGLKWSLKCLPDGKTVAETPAMSSFQDRWDAFELPFTVSTSGCSAQRLELHILARSDSETMLTGSVAFDALTIKPAATREIR